MKIKLFFEDGTTKVRQFKNEASFLRSPIFKSKGLKAWAIVTLLAETIISLTRILSKK